MVEDLLSQKEIERIYDDKFVCFFIVTALKNRERGQGLILRFWLDQTKFFCQLYWQ